MLEFRDTLIVPFSELMDNPTGGGFHRGGPIWPDWDEQRVARHCQQDKPIDARPEPADAVARLPDRIAWAGPIVRHFGHQVADFSMRILPTLARVPGVPLAFASHPRFGYHSLADVPPYFVAMLEWLGVDPGQVVLVEEPSLAVDLVVAPQAEQVTGPGPSEEHLDRLDELVEQRLGQVERSGTTYISRAGMIGRFAGEGALEHALQACDVKVVRPESMPLVEQLTTYATAERLVFAEGSAVHGTQLLGRSLGHVTVLLRRAGRSTGQTSLGPRSRSLEYVDATTALVSPIGPTGVPATPLGISILDRDQLLAALPWLAATLATHLTGELFEEARDEDVLTWFRNYLRSRIVRSPDSADQIIDALGVAGLAHLQDRARTIMQVHEDQVARLQKLAAEQAQATAVGDPG